jgi:hypothetical protein
MKNIFLLLAISLLPLKSFAWAEAGHRLVALIAYEQLSMAKRMAVLESLKAHEFYQTHFKDQVAKGVEAGASEEVINRWLFSNMAQWPDFIKGNISDFPDDKKFKGWHYIDEPFYLNQEDEYVYKGTPPTPLTRYYDGMNDKRKWNASQAYLFNLAIVNNPNESKAAKAEALCWIFHLLGDIHQPLHSSALFSKPKFENGDQGGNKIQVEELGHSMHAFWDDAPNPTDTDSSSNYFKKILDLMPKYSAPMMVAAGIKARESMVFETWIQESHHLAFTNIYTPEIMEKLKSAPAPSGYGPVKITLADAENYKKKTISVCDKRIVEAGYRLAKLLDSIYP